MSGQERRKQRLQVLNKHAGNDGAWAALLTLEAIEGLMADGGFIPTYREVADVRKLTIGGVQGHTTILAAAGLLSYQPGRPRTFKVLDTGTEKEEWVEVLHARIPRSITSKSEDVLALEIFPLIQAVEQAVDLAGSDIEIIIRHRP